MAVNAEEIAKAAKISFENAQLIPSSDRINALHAIKAELDSRKEEILAANKNDLRVGTAEHSSSQLNCFPSEGRPTGGRCRAYV